jgi:hypothetical protein
MKLCKLFLDHMASQEEPILTYKASDMVLALHSGASYLSEPKACSHAGGHMFMSANGDIPTNNGANLNILQIIRAVMSSAAEAELGTLFTNAKTAVLMRHTLEELGHTQPRTPIQTDNKTTNDLLTNKIIPKALKAMDMQFHWLRCRDAQGQFRYYWRPGTQNLADYFTKHHPASHHKASRPLSCFLQGNLPGNCQILPKTSDLGQSCGKVHDCGKITAFTCLPYLTIPYRSTKIFVSVPPKKHRTSTIPPTQRYDRYDRLR